MLDIHGFDAEVWDRDDAELGAAMRGVTYEPVATNNGGNYGEVFDVLGKAGNVLSGVATSIASFYGARNAVIDSRATADFQRDQQRLTNELNRAKLSGAVDIEKLRTQAEIARAQGILGNMPSLGSLLYGGSGQGSGSGMSTLIFLALAGGLIYWGMRK